MTTQLSSSHGISAFAATGSHLPVEILKEYF
jgi:hypothetical protein